MKKLENILKENMRRFGTKNLSEQSIGGILHRIIWPEENMMGIGAAGVRALKSKFATAVELNDAFQKAFEPGTMHLVNKGFDLEKGVYYEILFNNKLTVYIRDYGDLYMKMSKKYYTKKEKQGAELADPQAMKNPKWNPVFVDIDGLFKSKKAVTKLKLNSDTQSIQDVIDRIKEQLDNN